MYDRRFRYSECCVADGLESRQCRRFRKNKKCKDMGFTMSRMFHVPPPFPLYPFKHEIDEKHYKEDGSEVLSFLWWKYPSPNKYIYQRKRRSHHSSEKEHAMDQSWNKGIPPPPLPRSPVFKEDNMFTNLVFVTETSGHECYALVIGSTSHPPR